MTAQDNNLRKSDGLLEEILQHVRSIDHNVDEVLDRLGEYLDETRHDGDWHTYRYGDDNGYD